MKILTVHNPNNTFYEIIFENMNPMIEAMITLKMPEIPFNGNNSVAIFKPKQSIIMGANTTSMVLSVDPNKIIARTKPDFDVTIVANILAIRSMTKNDMMT